MSNKLRMLKVVKAAVVLLMVFSTACASIREEPSADTQEPSAETQEPSAETQDEAESPTTQNRNNGDTFEKYNRAVFHFNMTLDRWIVKPVAQGYDFILPDPVQIGVGNFFDNLKEVPNAVNDGLQWKWGQAANDSGRLLVNTTLGIAGLFDVAAKMGLEKSDGESFTQTLAVWGVPRGPYLVLPFLGPSTVRGVGSMPVDWRLEPTTYIDHFETKMSVKLLELLHRRADLLDAEELLNGDQYVFIREAFIQRLEYLEQDGKVEDSFGGDDFGDDGYDF